LFPVQVLSKIFRGIYITGLRDAYRKNILKLPEKLTDSLTSLDFDQLLNELMKKDWVVYAKAPFAGPEKLLNYLARYTHKIAISNHRILSCDAEFVTFRWRDYSDNNKIKVMQLKHSEFIRRFLSHVLPSGFMRIRSFGFLANACKMKKVKMIQEKLCYQPKQSTKELSIAEKMLELTGKDITICPVCKKGRLKRINNIPSKLNNKAVPDTS
jgi:Putative transposase